MVLCRVEAGFEERVEKIAGEPWPDDFGAEAHDVHVIVLDRLMRRMNIVTYRGADASHLVASDRRADARAANHDAALGVARANSGAN